MRFCLFDVWIRHRKWQKIWCVVQLVHLLSSDLSSLWQNYNFIYMEVMSRNVWPGVSLSVGAEVLNSYFGSGARIFCVSTNDTSCLTFFVLGDLKKSRRGVRTVFPCSCSNRPKYLSNITLGFQVVFNNKRTLNLLVTYFRDDRIPQHMEGKYEHDSPKTVSHIKWNQVALA